MRQTWRPDRLGVRTETERVRCSSCGQRHVVIYGLKCYPGQERDDVGLDCQRCGAEDITRIYYVGAYAYHRLGEFRRLQLRSQWPPVAIACGLLLLVVLGLFSCERSGLRLAVECEKAQLRLPVELRRAVLASAERALDHPLASARRRLNRGWRGAASSCGALRDELARVDAGLCPEHPTPGMRCECGAQRFPEDDDCQRPPRCAYRVAPARLECWRDPPREEPAPVVIEEDADFPDLVVGPPSS